MERIEAAQGGEGATLIGQFGVGFYSAFMVADRVDVVSRRAGTDEAWLWSSDGKGTFTVAPAALADAPQRGTRVILHLMEDAKTYTERSTLERMVKAQSGHVPVPIVIVEKPGAEGAEIADGAALWTKAEVRDHSRGIHRLLPQHRGAVRRAGADDAFPRRGAPRIHRARLRSGLAAVRPVRSRPQGPHQALRQARLHHRRGGDPAALSALRARAGGFRRPAAQRLARDDPGEPDPRRDQEGRDQPGARRSREARGEGAGRLRQDLGHLRRRAEGRALRGFRAPRRAARPGALQDHRRQRYVAEPEGLCRRAQGEPDRDLLHRGRRHRSPRSLAAPRRLPRARRRGSAACGPDRQLLGHVRRRRSRASRSSR